MPITHKNPLLWLLLLLTAWACLAAPLSGPKTASGNFYGQETASWEVAGREAAPRLGFGGSAGKFASAPLVGANTTLKPYSLTNEQTRIWYHEQLDAIPGRIDSTLPLRDQALQSFQLRNEVKLQARDLMIDRAAVAELPAPKTLSDVVRRAYEQGLRGDDVWLYVRDGATRSNTSVDAALGLTRK